LNLVFLLLGLAVLPFVNTAFAQEVINLNDTTPCFLNYTAGIQMWENCGADEDSISFAILPFEWITGGYFSMILVAIIILMVYLKYQKVVYGVVIGLIFLPVAFAFFPASFLGVAMIMVVMGIAAGIYFMLKRQTD
jgi:hypothetical protein